MEQYNFRANGGILSFNKFELPHLEEDNCCNWKQCSTNRMSTRQFYVFRYQNRVNSEVNSIYGKIGKFDEFDRVNTL